MKMKKTVSVLLCLLLTLIFSPSATVFASDVDICDGHVHHELSSDGDEIAVPEYFITEEDFEKLVSSGEIRMARPTPSRQRVACCGQTTSLVWINTRIMHILSGSRCLSQAYFGY